MNKSFFRLSFSVMFLMIGSLLAACAPSAVMGPKQLDNLDSIQICDRGLEHLRNGLSIPGMSVVYSGT
jgi:hypothetical protein